MFWGNFHDIPLVIKNIWGCVWKVFDKMFDDSTLTMLVRWIICGFYCILDLCSVQSIGVGSIFEGLIREWGTAGDVDRHRFHKFEGWRSIKVTDSIAASVYCFFDFRSHLVWFSELSRSQSTMFVDRCILKTPETTAQSYRGSFGRTFFSKQLGSFGKEKRKKENRIKNGGKE